MARDVFLCDAVRTPIGRYGGALAKVRTDDLAAVPIKALMARNPKIDWEKLDEVYYGCANQAGEDNRNVARMALLLAGLPASVPGVTLNRLCASGLDAVGTAARAIRAGEIDFAIAGGVESMTRAPFVQGKAQEAFVAHGRNLRHDDRLALRQSADEAAIRRRFDAGDRRKRGRGIPDHARRPGRFCAALAATRRQGDRLGVFRQRDRRGRSAGRQGGPDQGRQGRASASRHHARTAGQAQDSVSQSRHRHRRQCVRRQ